MLICGWETTKVIVGVPLQVRAKFKAYEPHLSVGGMAQEGQALAVNVSFPLLPPGHPEVSLRVLVTWLREDLGKYWLTDGDAIARSQLRQRGLYEPANFIPSVDLKPPDQRKYSVIEGETSLEYVCRKEDIGRRVGLTVQPISSLGQLGNVYTAWSFPAFHNPRSRFRGSNSSRAFTQPAKTGFQTANEMMLDRLHA